MPAIVNCSIKLSFREIYRCYRLSIIILLFLFSYVYMHYNDFSVTSYNFSALFSFSLICYIFEAKNIIITSFCEKISINYTPLLFEWLATFLCLEQKNCAHKMKWKQKKWKTHLMVLNTHFWWLYMFLKSSNYQKIYVLCL